MVHDNLPVFREVIRKVISRCQPMLHLSGEKNSTETDGVRCRQQLHRAMAVLRSTDRAAPSTHWLTCRLRMRRLVLNYTGPGLLLCRGRQLRVLRDTITARDGIAHFSPLFALPPPLATVDNFGQESGATGGAWGKLDHFLRLYIIQTFSLKLYLLI